MSLNEEDKLFIQILNDILAFCKKTGIKYNEELNTDFILTLDGE